MGNRNTKKQPPLPPPPTQEYPLPPAPLPVPATVAAVPKARKTAVGATNFDFDKPATPSSSTTSTATTTFRAAPAFGKDPSLNPRDFILQSLEGQIIIRKPGSIKGQQFMIENCKGCDIYLLDHTAQVTIDECIDCRIVIGPSDSSVFVRDCSKSVFLLACQQLRTRTCADIDVLLYSATRPIIESSHNVRFHCYNYSYHSLAEQFAKAGLCVWNNRWPDIYDFTPHEKLGDGPHFTTTTSAQQPLSSFVKPLPADIASEISYTEDPAMAIVPQTVGAGNRPPSSTHHRRLIVLTSEDGASSKATEVLAALRALSPDILLVQTRPAALEKLQAEELRGGKGKASAAWMKVATATAVGKLPKLGTAGSIFGMEVVLPKPLEADKALVAILSTLFPTARPEENRYHVVGGGSGSSTDAAASNEQSVIDMFFKQWRGSEDS